MVCAEAATLLPAGTPSGHIVAAPTAPRMGSSNASSTSRKTRRVFTEPDYPARFAWRGVRICRSSAQRAMGLEPNPQAAHPIGKRERRFRPVALSVVDVHCELHVLYERTVYEAGLGCQGSAQASSCAGLSRGWGATPQRYAGPQWSKVAAWPWHAPEASSRFHTTACSMRKRLPLDETLMPE